ncbi:FAS1 domain-containing protein [Lojkania enalia]|uniref:FAS1 domain-containing protein n=1 Tax=Lojkania enalia TaxID=147567 RepID=A0A9P4N4Z4_9PLEO|nr:FAS1 domain-containing protein [Didymosphaeria enalia]
MKSQIVVCVLASSLALCQTFSPGVSDLLTVLQSDPDTQAFAQLLREHPDLLTNLNSAKNYTVFAPSNAAVAEFRQSFNINGSLSRRAHGLYRRSIPDYAAAIALLFTDRSNQENLNIESTDLITNLTDSDFINLGPASASASPTSSSFSFVQSSSSSALSPSSSVPSTTISTLPSSSSTSPPSTSAPVSSSSVQAPGSTVIPPSSPQPPASGPATPTPPPPLPEPAHCPAPRQKKTKRSTSPYSNPLRRQLNESSMLRVYSGFGKVTEASLSEMTYDKGAVRKADSFFTLFGDLATTLQQTNGTAFANSLAQAGMLDSLSNTPRITVFVPFDAILTGEVLDASTLRRYILPNTLATSPSLRAGTYNTSAGDSVNITTNSAGSFSVNNATIVKSDVMIKNGVIHYINNVYTSTSTGSAPGITSSMILVVVAFLMASTSLL